MHCALVSQNSSVSDEMPAVKWRAILIPKYCLLHVRLAVVNGKTMSTDLS